MAFVKRTILIFAGLGFWCSSVLSYCAGTRAAVLRSGFPRRLLSLHTFVVKEAAETDVKNGLRNSGITRKRERGGN